MGRSLLSLFRIGVGLILLMTGIIGLLLPILPGWLLIFVAIPLISIEHGKKMSARLKTWKEKGGHWWNKKKKENDIPPH